MAKGKSVLTRLRESLKAAKGKPKRERKVDTGKVSAKPFKPTMSPEQKKAVAKAQKKDEKKSKK